MPNEVVEGTRLPRPFKEEFDNFTDLLNQIKAYSKEIGFSVVSAITNYNNMPAHLSMQGIGINRIVKRIICSKNHKVKKQKETEIA